MPEDEKLFYTIGEAAQLLNVKPYVLRYWETEVKKLNPQKSETGQRTYRKKDLQVAMTLKRLLYDEKYTIAGAILKLDELEKSGYDQLNIFGTDQPEQSKPETNLSAETILHQQVKPHPPRKPAYSSEKAEEFRGLIKSTRTILGKYDLV